MQYVDYQYAKDNGIIGPVLAAWIKGTPDLNIHTRGHVIKDWREEKCLLNIGEQNSGSLIPEIIEQWTKLQANPKYHKQSYMMAYLKGYFKV
jgi:hypothetical protein